MIFFDAVGTLFETRQAVGEIYASIGRRHGLLAAPDVLQRRFAELFPIQPPLAFAGSLDSEQRLAREMEWWKGLVAEVWCKTSSGGNEDDFEAYFVELFEHFATIDPWRLFPETLRVIEELRELGYRLGVISNFDSRLHRILEGFGIDEFFDGVFISSEVGAAKPVPGIFEIALARSHVLPDEAIHIGDSRRDDFEGAANAGIAGLLVDRKRDVPFSELSGCISSLDEIFAFL